ncbi:hypothetical protein ACIPY3_22145 [Paenarthrobacter sp. NPDC089714]|uniref:hypothetical protein n=1 Tax=Paenarthrobacter sp. NPDC089714 TaxID=3364377 RepID=UPI0037F1D00F
MTLLCSFHHDEKTLNRLPITAVRKANKSPYNRTKTLGSSHPLYFDGPTLDVQLGSFTFVGSTDAPECTIIEVDGEPIFRIRFEEDGFISLDLTIRDHDNHPVLIIRRGELRHSTTTWDVEFEAQTLTVRRASRDIILRIQMATPDRIVIERAELWAAGIFIRVGASCLEKDGGIEVANVGSAGFKGGKAGDFKVMAAIGDYLGTEGAGVTIPVAKRWYGGVPAVPGSFSKYGGGQNRPYTDPWYLSTCSPTPHGSYLLPALWGA